MRAVSEKNKENINENTNASISEKINEKNNGKLSKKYLIIYSATLFSIAFLLILLSYFAQLRTQEQLKENIDTANTLTSRISTIVEENDNLKKQVEDLTAIANEKEILEGQLQEKVSSSENIGKLIEAGNLYRQRKYKDAKAALLLVVPDTLTGSSQVMYNDLTKLLKKY